MVSTVTWRSGREVRARLGQSPWAFFGLALGWSWLFWIPLALSAESVREWPRLALLGLGGAGPLVAALALLYLVGGAAERRDYWQRLLDWRRVGRDWWLVALALPLAWSLLGLGTGALLGDTSGALAGASEYLRRPLWLAPAALLLLVFGPLPQELGWRGYVQDRLRSRWGALWASLVLGAFWTLWQLPLFFVEGAPLGEVFPLGSPTFWVGWVAANVAQCVLFSWLYANTGRSTLVAVAHHWAIALLAEALGLRGTMVVYRAVWVIFCAVAVATIWGPRTLAAPEGRSEVDAPERVLAA